MAEYGWPYPRRRELLDRLIKTVSGETYPVPFQGRLNYMQVYSVPIGMPKYRLANGRTRAPQREWLATHQVEDKDLFSRDLESDRAQELQHHILENLLGEGEKNLIEFFKDHAQELPLIVTHDGFVLNGNRRLCAMRNLYFGSPDAFGKFANVQIVILPPADERDLDRLEAELQIKADIKEDYSWISFALMLRERQQEHGYTDAELGALYTQKASEIRNLIDMLSYAEDYLRRRGQPEQYHLVESSEYAFRQVVDSRRKVKGDGSVTNFEGLAYLLIARPEGRRVYEEIPDVARYLQQIEAAIAAEFPQTDQASAGNGEYDEVLGSGTKKVVDLAPLIADDEKSARLRTLVRETIESQRGLDKDRKRTDFVIAQAKKANSSLSAALNMMTEKASKIGVEEQLCSIETSIRAIREWLKS